MNTSVEIKTEEEDDFDIPHVKDIDKQDLEPLYIKNEIEEEDCMVTDFSVKEELLLKEDPDEEYVKLEAEDDEEEEEAWSSSDESNRELEQEELILKDEEDDDWDMDESSVQLEDDASSSSFEPRNTAKTCRKKQVCKPKFVDCVSICPTTRKHVTLTLEQKQEVIRLLDSGVSYLKVAKRFGIGKTTVADIKKKKLEILGFISRTELGSGKRKTLRNPENPAMENALYTWLLQQRRLNVPITGEIIMAKAQYFHENMTRTKNFKANRGWLNRFKKRHGIRQLKIGDDDDLFRAKLRLLIKDFTPQQIYNAHESELFYRALPNESSNQFKDRITFMPCANASGDQKLQLLVIGRFKTAKEFTLTKLPVCYQNNKNICISKQIFLHWFKNEFVPNVRQYLRKNNLLEKAILLLDNVPGYPSEEELTSHDGKIFAKFLPENLIQPINQNIIQNIKLLFRKKFLKKVVTQQDDGNDNISEMLKNISLKDVLFELATSWDAVSEYKINKSWKGLLPELHSKITTEYCLEDTMSFSLLLNRLKDSEPLSEAAALEWAQGGAEQNLMQMLADDEIIALEGNDTDEHENKNNNSKNEKINVTTVSHSEALLAFNKCIRWADENNVSIQDVLLLRRMRDDVINKKYLDNSHNTALLIQTKWDQIMCGLTT